jgi:Fe-Mn family superoxide dismutase
MTFTLPNLPYAYDALAPHMSKETLEYHHDKHHQAYVTNGNNAIKGTEFEGKSLEEIVKGSFGKNAAVFNNAGQHYNHLHFWNWMKPHGGGSKLPGRLEKKISEDLGGFEKFKTDFAAAGVGQFGSGWCWLQVKNGKLEISKTPNGENPLVHGATPILGCDVWEPSGLFEGVDRQPDQLGICRPAVREGRLTNAKLFRSECRGGSIQLPPLRPFGREPRARGIAAWASMSRAWVWPLFRLHRCSAETKQI